MKTLILHLTDLHIDESVEQILPYTIQIKKSLQTLLDSNIIDFILIVVTGDIAKSGRSVEYGKVRLFLKKLAEEIGSQNKIDLDIIAVPGNHDCNHSNGISRLEKI